MKIFAISDLHLSVSGAKPMKIFGSGWDDYLTEIKSNWRATDDDLTLIAGDISWAMHLNEAKEDLQYIASLPGRKVLLRGNHDYWWKSISAVRKELPYGVDAVQNDCLRYGSALICGSRGWVFPENLSDEENLKIFNRELIRIELSLKCMEKIRKEGDFVIAMTHYPPFDTKFQPSVVTNLFSAYNVDKVVYGHLHGKVYFKPRLTIGKTEYIMTSCDLIGNNPVLVQELI